MVKLALVDPAGTVTLAGTLAAPGWLLDKLTTAPLDGAAFASVTVPVDGLPPVTLVGVTVNVDNVAGDGVGLGVTVSVADLVTPPPDTEIVTTVVELTGCVKMSKPPFVTPAGYLSGGGTLGVTVGVPVRIRRVELVMVGS